MAGPKRLPKKQIVGDLIRDELTKKGAPKKGAKNNVVELSFDSLSELGDYVHTLHEKGVLGYEPTFASQKIPRQDWDYNTSFEQALEITRNGGAWLKGAEQLASVEISQGDIDSYIIKPFFDLAPVGGCVDVGEYLAGNPECMLGFNDDEPTTPVIAIRFICVPSHHVTANQLFYYGRALLALIDSLELQGYSVELIAVYPLMKTSNKGLIAETIVKQAGEQWSAGAVAFAICHPAFSRRVGFRLAEAFDETASARERGYSLAGYAPPKNDGLYFGYIGKHSPVKTPTEALAYVMNQAKYQKPELFA